MMFQREITKEEVAKLGLIQFEGPITIIQTGEALADQIGIIESHPILGFDTESRPSFKKG